MTRHLRVVPRVPSIGKPRPSVAEWRDGPRKPFPATAPRRSNALRLLLGAMRIVARVAVALRKDRP